MNGQSNFNFTLLANANDFPTVGYNDIWGFVDKNGIEYAVLGTLQATVIYSLEDPTQPNIVAEIPGAQSIWRDMKSFGEFIFVVADQGNDGMLIIDMSDAPNEVTWDFWQPSLMDNGAMSPLNRCHNLYVDEAGYCYLSGCNLNNGGIMIIDVNDPSNPTFVGQGDRVYSHDNFSRGDTIWSADISAGYFSVIDASDKTMPVTLATQRTSFDFTHNCWLSDDGKFLFTTDERNDAAVDAYDVSDLENIKFLDDFRPLDTEGLGVVPHNTHYKAGYLFTSWYTDGLVITDATKPDNLIEVGHYDTYSGPDGGFNGCWGAFPFLPSGIILASDRQTGLYVLQPNLVRACYLEGIVTDLVTGLGLDGVKVEIQSEDTNRATTNFAGNYKTGQATSGNFDVIFEKEGYRTETISVNLQNGVVEILDVTLVPLQQVAFRGRTIDAQTGEPVPNAAIALVNGVNSSLGRSNEEGNFEISVFIDQYQIQSGAWGYLNTMISNVNVDGNNNLEIALSPGYQDDFFADLGWEAVADSATSGFWELGQPVRTIFGGNQVSNPGEDAPFDIGESCYVTGNGGGTAGFDDVDNGKVTLISPPIDLTDYENPILTFSYWFFNAGGAPPVDDQLVVYVEQNDNRILIDSFVDAGSTWNASNPYPLKELIALEDTLRIVYETEDLADSGHLVEAGIDAFLIFEEEEVTEDSTITSIDFAAEADFASAFPNPFVDQIKLNVQPDYEISLAVYNGLGVLVEGYKQVNASIVLGANWTAGVYFIKMEGTKNNRTYQQRLKVLKH